MKYLLILCLSFMACKEDPSKERVYFIPNSREELILCKELEYDNYCGVTLKYCAGDPSFYIYCATNIRSVTIDKIVEQ